MIIKPLPGWVLIEPLEEDQSVGGIKLPDSTQDYPMKGKVLETGSAVLSDFEFKALVEEKLFNPSVFEYINYKPGRYIKEGDYVYFKKFSGQDIKHEGKEYKLVEFKDLLALVE